MTSRNQPVDPAFSGHTTAWIHHCTKHGNTSTAVDRAESKDLYLSDEEATATYQLWGASPKLDRLSYSKEAALHGASLLPALGRLTTSDL